jgi:UDP-N-acetylmuramoyl-tripeptide--D-alanyl-D-alanine ligase
MNHLERVQITLERLIPSIPVIGVTGSAGKTTTKEMIASILGRRYKIFKSIGNMNWRFNTRSYARQITPQHLTAVLEMGMGKIGSGKAHCRFIQPNIGVITSIGTAHHENFGGEISKVVKVKSELIQYMKRDGLAVIKKDDPNSNQII